MTSTGRARTARTSAPAERDRRADPVWSGAPYPALVIDAQDAVERANDAAVALLPRARPGVALADAVPPWLAEAHRGGLPPDAPAPRASGPIGERSFEAHPARQADGRVVWWLVDDTELQDARASLSVERERTAFLAQASNRLLSSLNLERCVEVAAQLAAGHLADAALVITRAPGRRLRIVRCLRGGRPAPTHEDVDPDELPGLSEALRGFPPVPSRWIDPDLAPRWAVPEGVGEVGSLVVTPLPGHGVPAGALVLLRLGDGTFSREEEAFARLFAARAGAAMSAARMYAEQASITETLMRELLPPTLHQVSGVEYAGGYRASRDAERIGGDFYDVHPAPTQGDASLAVLGDVCGKGLNAAVLTGKIRNTLHALLPMADDHQRMIDLLNGALLNSHHARFATLVLASAVRESSSVSLRLTSAGHAAPLIVRADGRVEEVATRGTLVGALPEVTAVTVEESLAPGESCVLYTDGITEAKGGPLGEAMFGEERLRGALAHCAGMPAEAIVEHVQMLASQWVGDRRHDDMAVVVISAPRTHHLSAVDGRTRGRFTA